MTHGYADPRHAALAQAQAALQSQMRQHEELYIQGGQPLAQQTGGPLPVPVPTARHREQREPAPLYAHHSWAPQPGEAPIPGYRNSHQHGPPGPHHGHFQVGLSPSASWSSLDSAPTSAPSHQQQQRPPSSAPKRSPRTTTSRASLFDNDGDDNFKVVIRVRPPLPREAQTGKPYRSTSLVDESQRVITLSENLQAATAGHSNGMLYATYRFTFDHVYDQDSRQEEVYETSARSAVHNTLQGYNAAIVAYGQTGTGKTYTMEGAVMTGPERGIIPRAIEDVFINIENDAAPSSKYLVRASYLQIYNEVISDLLKPEKTNLVIREDRKRGVFVDGLSEWVVRSPAEVYSLMERGASMRTTGATKMNEISSRSHAVFIVIVENSVTLGGEEDEEMQQQLAEQLEGMGMIQGGGNKGRRGGGRGSGPLRESVRVGKMNLVDLAGSERVHITGATGKRLEESKKINQSLSALGNVIGALTESKPRQHIPYRDSKLTRILEDSLGGNCKTTMMCMISPALEAFPESLSTLKFANRAKNIRNVATVNEDVDQRTLLKKYERELRRLRQELAQRSKDLVDKRRLLELEEQKKRAEADKLAAITALEQRSREFMVEKEEKRQLEARINSMQSQLLIGGHKVEDMPAFRSLLKKEQRRIRSEYEERLRELEKERQNVEQDKAQVDRYKHLLLKQRDIMIALTQRLNERDEQILAMQEELEAYDRHQRRLEDALDQKTAELIALRKAAVEHMGNSPMKSTPLQSALGDWGGGESDEKGSGLIVAGKLGATEAQLTPHWEEYEAEITVDTRRDRPAGATKSELKVDSKQVSQHVHRELAERLEEQNNQVAMLEDENARLRAALAAAADSAPKLDSHESSAAESELVTLREQFANHAKERTALKTILESKIHALVGDIQQSVHSLGGEVGQPGSRILRQVGALDKLVGATVNAMRAVTPA